MKIDFTQVIIAIIGLVFSLITAYIVPVVKKWLQEKRLYNTAAVLVGAAKTYFADGNGEEKYQYCLEQLRSKFGKYFDIDEIGAAIQSAYVDLKASLGEEPSLKKDDLNENSD